MLHSISIRNFIIIDKLDLEFDSNLCIITGQTGAGKSILLKALLFCLNYIRVDEPLRLGENHCTVTTIFSMDDEIRSILLEKDIIILDELTIKRTQTSTHKKFFINDQVVTAKTINEIAKFLFELHGQNSHTLLLDESYHINILDEYGNLSHLLDKLNRSYKDINTLEQELNDNLKNQEKIKKDVEFIKFSIEELKKVNIKSGEEEHLANIRKQLQNQDKNNKLVEELISCIQDSNINKSIIRATKILSKLSADELQIERINTLLDNISINLNELEDIISSTFLNNQYLYHLDEVEERLFMIRSLTRKYNMPSDELCNFLQAQENKILKLELSDENIIKIQADIEKIKQEYNIIASELSHKRKEVASSLENLMHDQLSALHMEKVDFKIEITTDDQKFTTLGIDKAIFTASTNPGMPHRSIASIASGGELARFMLALRAILTTKRNTKLIIFDEVDTGVSGIVAESIGNSLKELSNVMQVLVITHHVQVASKATQHLFVSKNQEKNNTTVAVKILNKEERTKVLASMISGNIVTENSINAVKDLLS